jgi:MoaA/NifB/PqqE/SkfB family radical SAM enzyme
MKMSKFFLERAFKIFTYSICLYSHKNFGFPPILPSNVLLATTYKCNSRCMMCNIWRKYQKSPNRLKEELTLDEFIDFVNKNRFLRKIALTGGEPFLRKDLYDMVIFLDERGYNVEITTNAILIKKIKLEESKILNNLSGNVPHNLSISIDGLEKTHDYLRGVNGNFKKAINLLKWAMQQTKKYDFFTTSISHTITRTNYIEFAQFFDFFNNFGLRPEQITFRLAQVSSQYFENIKSNEIPNNFDKIYEQVKKVLNKYQILKCDVFYQGLLRYLKNPYKQVFPCSVGFSFCYIDPYWNVYPCISWMKNLGNLRDFDLDLKKFWKSESLRETRELVKDEKCPNCWSQCTAIPTINSNIFILPKRYWNFLLSKL